MNNKQRTRKYPPITDIINAISYYFGVSDECAKYMYFRVLRSHQTDYRYLEWTLPMQNALVQLDKVLANNWKNVSFGNEELILNEHKIYLSKMSNNQIFTWVDHETETNEQNSEWIKVTRKKRKRKKYNNGVNKIRRVGLFV